MKKKLVTIGLSLLLPILFLRCGEMNLYVVTTDHNGYADETFKAPEDGKIKIFVIDGVCNETNLGGKYYWTHFQFLLETYTIILDCNCDKFQPTEYINVKKGDRIRFIIQHGELTSKYNVRYEFIKK
jgi:hypothetical protein